MGKSIIKRIFEIILLTWLLAGSAALIYLMGTLLLVMGREKLELLGGFSYLWDNVLYNGLITFFVLPLPVFVLLAMMVSDFLHSRKSAVRRRRFFAWLAVIIVVLLYLGITIFSIFITLVAYTST